MKVRQLRKGGPWYLDYREGGKRVRAEIGTKADAEKELKRRMAARVLKRRHRGGAATNRVALAFVKEAWFKDVELHCKPRTAQRYKECVEAILARIPARNVEDVTPPMLTAYAEGAMKNGITVTVKTPKRGARQETRVITARTCNRHIGYFKAMLKWAVQSALIESNPVENVRPLHERKVRHRRALTEDEARALLEKSPACYRRIWTFMLGTGFRTNETVNLDWEDVNLERQEIRLSAERSKNNTAAIVPLSDTVADMLRDMQRETGATSGYVFLNRDGKPWKNNLVHRLRSCCRAAGVETWGIDLHALRYSFATHLLRAGVPIQTVQRLGRWKTVDVLLSVYAQTFPADERAAVERLPYFSTSASGQKADTRTRAIA
jgi:integrase